MQILININQIGEAFSGVNCEEETRRVVQKFAANMSPDMSESYTRKIYDYNGNNCGTAKVTHDATDSVSIVLSQAEWSKIMMKCGNIEMSPDDKKALSLAGHKILAQLKADQA